MSRSGLASQWGFKEETTFGTPVTVTEFLPMISESIKRTEDFQESEAQFAGRRVLQSGQWNGGNVEISGDIETELWSLDLETLLKHMMGSRSGTGTSGSPWVATPGDLFGLGLTVQLGKPDVGGTTRAFTYGGVKIPSWEISCQAGQIARLRLRLFGTVEENRATALASASYTAALRPFKWNHGAVTVAESAVNVKSFRLSGDNGLALDRRFLGSKLPSQPIEADLRRYEGQLVCEFESLTAYERFVNRTEAALVITFTDGTRVLTITANVRFDGETPSVGGRGILEQPLPFTCVASGADSTALSISFAET